MTIIISNFWDKWKGSVIPVWRFLDMQMGMKALVIGWTKEEQDMGQIIRHIYAMIKFLSQLCNIFLARSIALKQCYLMMNYEKKSFYRFLKYS